MNKNNNSNTRNAPSNFFQDKFLSVPFVYEKLTYYFYWKLLSYKEVVKGLTERERELLTKVDFFSKPHTEDLLIGMVSKLQGSEQCPPPSLVEYFEEVKTETERDRYLYALKPDLLKTFDLLRFLFRVDNKDNSDTFIELDSLPIESYLFVLSIHRCGQLYGSTADEKCKKFLTGSFGKYYKYALLGNLPTHKHYVHFVIWK